MGVIIMRWTGVFVTFAAVLIAVVCFGAPLLPDGGQIAFSRYEAVDDDIWLVDLRTRIAVDVTHADTSREIAPVWSPDGRWLAYIVSGMPTMTRIAMKDFIGGGDDERLFTAIGGQLRPRWTSSDDVTLVPEDRLFWRHDERTNERVLAVLRAGIPADVGVRVARTSTTTPNLPSVMPELRDVAHFNAINRDLTYEIVSLWSPAWSLDERYLAVQTFIGRQIDLVVIDSACLDDSCAPAAWRLTNTPSPDVEPAWSPDNTRIAFSCNDGENQEICVVDVDGRGLQQVTQTPAGVVNRMPAWRPGR